MQASFAPGSYHEDNVSGLDHSLVQYHPVAMINMWLQSLSHTVSGVRLQIVQPHLHKAGLQRKHLCPCKCTTFLLLYQCFCFNGASVYRLKILLSKTEIGLLFREPNPQTRLWAGFDRFLAKIGGARLFRMLWKVDTRKPFCENINTFLYCLGPSP